MIKITKEDFLTYIKPLEDQVYDLLNKKKLNSADSILTIDSLMRIAQAEFSPEKLLDELNKLTPLQLKVLSKYGLAESISQAKEHLSSRK